MIFDPYNCWNSQPEKDFEAHDWVTDGKIMI